MGQMSRFLAILIFVDVLFLTFWGGSTSLNSLIISWATNANNFTGNAFYTVIANLLLVIAAFGIGTTVIPTQGARTDTVLFASFATVLLNLGLDLVFMYNEVNQVSPTIAILTMFPIMALYVFTVIEWLRGKDN